MAKDFSSDAIFEALGFQQVTASPSERHYEGHFDSVPVKVHYQWIYKTASRSYAGSSPRATSKKYEKSSMYLYIDAPTILTRFQVAPYGNALSKMQRVDLSYDPAYEGKVVIGLDPAWSEQVATDTTTRDPLLRLTRQHETTNRAGAVQIQPGTVTLHTFLLDSELSEEYVRSYLEELVTFSRAAAALPATYTPVKATVLEKSGVAGSRIKGLLVLGGIAVGLVGAMILCIAVVALLSMLTES